MVRTRTMWAFLLKFVFWSGLLMAINVSTPGQTYLVTPFTTALARFCAELMHLVDADVQSAGRVVWSAQSNFGISIEAACNGVEAMIILFAGLMAFPASLRQRLVGLIVGTLAIQLLNVVRIVSLFYLGQWNKDWFEFFHLYLWQMLIILDAFFVWLLWLRWVFRDRRGAGPGAGTGGTLAASPA